MRATPDLSAVRWRKSSYSGNEQGDACIEVCDGFPSTVPVRDSKNTAGPVLVLGGAAWQLFVDNIKSGSL
ncbi:DUF397 domain-containing protein [Streptomyces sp. NBC_00554]|uniref:DUF397 domain-containing protein n=1 Tax=unclassified Streptomyces TaxID=2593676 RepID=UPI00352F12E3|nr:DUF397 domain-containing protein [Streptomyces sp. NBC_00564]WUC49872.1 DUF397 domain-containing protein [Streptomyces sp. NBC_00554]